MRTRLRPVYTKEQLEGIYQKPHDASRFGRGHGERVEATIRMGRTINPPPTSIADLSCGNAAIAFGIADKNTALVLGDFASGYFYTGPIEETIQQIPSVNLFILSETLEHLDDPDAVLREIRAKTKMLLLSTPTDNFDDANGEHYWAWTKEDVDWMVSSAGFKVRAYDKVDSREYGEPYLYSIWLWE